MRKTILLSLIIGSSLSAVGQPVLWSGNGHYYELVSGNITWTDAKAAAEVRTSNGMHGHLATITSVEENNFIASQFGVAEGGKFAWIGGQEPGDDGNWFWVTGPEKGIQFSIVKTATPPFLYANWGGVEPNDNKDGEDYLMLNLGGDFAGIRTGQWADAIDVPNASDPVLGYVVEYELALPALTIKLLDTDHVEISFETVAGQRYQLQSNADLNSTNWSAIDSAINGDSSTVWITQTLQPGNMFFRVEVAVAITPGQ